MAQQGKIFLFFRVQETMKDHDPKYEWKENVFEGQN